MHALNSEQHAAAESNDGPQLILAGAGSGKTRTVVHRIGHLIARRGIAPHRILSLTFTNKAANELKMRLSELIGDDGGGVISGTFHAISLRFLRRYADALGFPASFQIIDSDDQKALIKRILKQRNIAAERLHPSFLLHWIEQCKHTGLLPEHTDESHWNNICLNDLYAEYQHQLKLLERMDFSDLILFTVILLRDHADIAAAIRSRFDHVLVDEYQDTNPVQSQWLQLLCAEHHNLTVVGDDDQSIYGWRGADVRHILDFEQLWPNAHIHYLTKNYRSTPSILALANAVIQTNEDRHPKQLEATQPDAALPEFVICNDEYAEARHIIAYLQARQARGVAWQDMAILYRSNRQSLALEQQLRETHIPYQIIGGLGFFERMEIKDALAYWALLAGCADITHLIRICNKPKRGLGPKGQEQLLAALRSSGMRVPEWMTMLARSDSLPASLKKIQPLAQALQDTGHRDDSETGLIQLLESCGYIESLKAMGELESVTRIEHIESLQRYINMSMEQGLTAIEFMDRAALLQTQDEQEDETSNHNKISLMSLHRAKGLEFDTVVIAGVEDGLLPHQRSIDDGEESLAEECRLLYVGITRAKKQLLMTSARIRRLFGETHYALASRFLRHLPASLIQRPINEPHPTVMSPQGCDMMLSSIGSNVRHPSFGQGVVLSVEGSGDAIRVSIQFERAGIKRLMLKYASLELL